jgi:hypothetical protein
MKIDGKKIILPDGHVPDSQPAPVWRQKATDRENRRSKRKRQNRTE